MTAWDVSLQTRECDTILSVCVRASVSHQVARRGHTPVVLHLPFVVDVKPFGTWPYVRTDQSYRHLLYFGAGRKWRAGNVRRIALPASGKVSRRSTAGATRMTERAHGYDYFAVMDNGYRAAEGSVIHYVRLLCCGSVSPFATNQTASKWSQSSRRVPRRTLNPLTFVVYATCRS